MNELIRIENGEVKLDSRMIAEHFGKEHKNVLSDIRDEIEKLENAGLGGELIFQPFSYKIVKQRITLYNLNHLGGINMSEPIEIMEMKDIMRIYGFPWNYAYQLVNEKGCPVLPRRRNQKIRVVRSEFENWLRSYRK